MPPFYFIYLNMLKKKILGAKVLDTNGYVQATRPVTPTNNESEAADVKGLFNQGASKPAHQIGDIYNANTVDAIIARAVSQGDPQLNDQVNAEVEARKVEDKKLGDRIAALESDKLTSKVVIYATDVIEYIPNNTSSSITIQLQNANGIISKDADYTHKHLYYNINNKGEIDVQDDNVNVKYKYDAPSQVNVEARGTATYKGIPITFPVVRKTIFAVLPSYIGYIEDYNNWNNTGTKLIKHSLNGQYNVVNPYDLAYIVIAIPKNGMVSNISSIIQKGTLDAVQQYDVIDKDNYTLYVCRTKHNKGTYTFAVS